MDDPSLNRFVFHCMLALTPLADLGFLSVTLDILFSPSTNQYVNVCFTTNIISFLVLIVFSPARGE